MLHFFTRAFAVIGALATLLVVIAIGAAFYLEDKPQPKPDEIILTLDFDQPIVEHQDPSPIDLALNEEATTLLDILRAIDKAKSDPHVKALVARFGGMQPSMVQAQEIRAALARFRASGKPTYAFASSYGQFGMGNRAYYLASGFEHIWLQPVGSVGLTGLAIEAPFARTALEKIGVKADFLKREEYKSFMDMATRDDFAPPVRVMMQGMMDDLADQIAAGIAESRKWDKARVKTLMANGPFTDEEALKSGLVTRIGYADELNAELKEKAGTRAKKVEASTYLRFGGGKTKEPKARIALIYGTGMIMDRSDGPADISGEKIMGADKIVDAFDDAVRDESIKGIMFRIDSPGGSPEASETIRRAMINAQKKGKPVVVSMGGIAASGGYWIAMNADKIVASPATITGSIGVVAGKFVVGGLMEKLGIHWGEIKTTENAGLWSMTEMFTPAQRAKMNAFIDRAYQAFLKNVSTARKIPMEKMPDIAKGRVWTGAQAVKIGLVDQLGGHDVALVTLRQLMKLEDKDLVQFEVFPQPLSPTEKALKLLKGFGIESAMLRTVLGQWQKIQVVFGPVWNAAGKPIEARAPDFVRQATE